MAVVSFLQNVCEVENWNTINMKKPSIFHNLIVYIFIPFAIYIQPFFFLFLYVYTKFIQ